MHRQPIWDPPDDPEGNTWHITVTNAHRGISCDDVEAVLCEPETEITPLPSGRDRYLGRLRGRPVVVIAMGEREVYPVTAIWINEAKWRTYRGD
jgi:hypothetical protein